MSKVGAIIDLLRENELTVREVAARLNFDYNYTSAAISREKRAGRLGVCRKEDGCNVFRTVDTVQKVMRKSVKAVIPKQVDIVVESISDTNVKMLNDIILDEWNQVRGYLRTQGRRPNRDHAVDNFEKHLKELLRVNKCWGHLRTIEGGLYHKIFLQNGENHLGINPQVQNDEVDETE